MADGLVTGYEASFEPAMRAALGEEADPPVACAEDDEILAEQTHAGRGIVRDQRGGHDHREPGVRAQVAAHESAAVDAGQALVLL